MIARLLILVALVVSPVTAFAGDYFLVFNGASQEDDTFLGSFVEPNGSVSDEEVGLVFLQAEDGKDMISKTEIGQRIQVNGQRVVVSDRELVFVTSIKVPQGYSSRWAVFQIHSGDGPSATRRIEIFRGTSRESAEAFLAERQVSEPGNYELKILNIHDFCNQDYEDYDPYLFGQGCP